MTNMVMPQHKIPWPSIHQIYNFGTRYLLGNHYCILCQSDLCLGVEKKIFKEIHQFYTFKPKLISPWSRGGGGMKFTFPVSRGDNFDNMPNRVIILALCSTSHIYLLIKVTNINQFQLKTSELLSENKTLTKTLT